MTIILTIVPAIALTGPAHGVSGALSCPAALTCAAHGHRRGEENDVEGGTGQCIAEMEAARQFNEESGRTAVPVFGCVTTGETWQFLRLADGVALLDRRRYYLDNVSGILGMIQAIYQASLNVA